MKSKMSKKTDWDLIMDGTNATKMVEMFANGELSRDDFYRAFANGPAGGEVRRLIRPPVSRARQIAKKALKRRGITVN